MKKTTLAKRIGVCALILILVICSVVMINSEEPSSWAKAEVSAAVSAGLVPSQLQKNYTSPVTRGQVAGMFMNLLEKASGKTADALMSEKGVSISGTVFSDTRDSSVLAANALGIINGTGNGTFAIKERSVCPSR